MLKVKFLGSICVAAVVVACVSTQASATLIGDQIRLEVETSVGNIFDEVFTAIDPGVDITPFDQFSIDFDSNSDLIITKVTTVEFIEFDLIFTDLDWVGNLSGILTGVSVTNDPSGWINTATLTGDHSFTLNLNSGFSGALPSATVHLTTEHGENPTLNSIPEPLTASLGLMGLGVLGMATRRRVA